MQRIFRWTDGEGIVEVGADACAEQAVCSEPALADSPALLVLPPLWDHHGHIAAHGAALEQVDLRGASSLEEALEEVERAAAGDSEWLEGFGWDQNRWGGSFPDRRDLDAIMPHSPVLLRRIDGHAGWVNTEALRRAGFDDGSSDPPGGRLLRESGRLTGIVLDGALTRVEACLPAPDDPALRRRMLAALEDLKRSGLSGVTDMGLEPAHVKVLSALDREGALPIGVEGFLWVREGDPEPQDVYRGVHFSVTGAKFFADGALGSRGAALWVGYADQPDNRGLLLWETDRLASALARTVARGLTPAVHAIGDRAVSQVLDAVEQARVPPGARVEHVQIAGTDAVERMARLGIVASVQPCHYLSDRQWAEARLGDGMRNAYRWGSLARRGVPLLMGTDFPIESPDPVRTFKACLNREEAGERLTFAEVLEGYRPPAGFAPRSRAAVGAFDPADLTPCGGPVRLSRCVAVAGGERIR